MDSPSSKNFLTSLSYFIQSSCRAFVEFDSCVLISGHIYLSVDAKSNIEYVLNEKLLKSPDSKFVFKTNSFQFQNKVDDSIAETKPKVHNDVGKCQPRYAVPENVLNKKQSTIQTQKRKHSPRKPNMIKKKDKNGQHSSEMSSLTKDLPPCTETKPDVNYTCDYCMKAFAQLKDLKVHHRKHAGEKIYSCEICNKEFAYLNNMRKHKNRVHKIVETNKGKSTERKLESDSAFTDFEGDSDPPVKPRTRAKKGQPTGFRCEVCTKEFPGKRDLQCHMNIHTGDKPFMCETCGKGFAQKVNLVGHSRTHTGERPFPCAICDQRFALSTSLRKHMRLHTGEKPYVCELCGFSSRTSSNLTRHRRFKHAFGPKPLKVRKNSKKVQTVTVEVEVKKEESDTSYNTYSIQTNSNTSNHSHVLTSNNSSTNSEPTMTTTPNATNSSSANSEYVLYPHAQVINYNYGSGRGPCDTAVFRGSFFPAPFAVETIFDPYKRQQFLSEHLNKQEF